MVRMTRHLAVLKSCKNWDAKQFRRYKGMKSVFTLHCWVFQRVKECSIVDKQTHSLQSITRLSNMNDERTEGGGGWNACCLHYVSHKQRGLFIEFTFMNAVLTVSAVAFHSNGAGSTLRYTRTFTLLIGQKLVKAAHVHCCQKSLRLIQWLRHLQLWPNI